MTRRLLSATIIAGTIAVSTGSAGAAAAKTTPAAKWSAAVCSAVTSWVDDFKSGNDDLSSRLIEADDLATAKTEFGTSLDQAIALTDQAAQTLARLGQPKVRNGAKITAAFDQGFQAAKAQFVSAKEKAAALPIDDTDAYLDAVDGVTDAISSAPDSVTDAINSINDLDTSGALLKAFVKQKACKEYVFGG